MKRGGDVEDDIKNLPYRSALKSFEVERSYIPRERSKKDAIYNIKKNGGTRGQGEVEGSKHNAGQRRRDAVTT